MHAFNMMCGVLAVFFGRYAMHVFYACSDFDPYEKHIDICN